MEAMRHVVLLSAVLAFAACADELPRTGNPSSGTVTFEGGATLEVRIADQPKERERGLMGVESLAPDDGMAFVFDEPSDSSFWMKDTVIPLSIAFVDGARVVAIEEMTPCETDPCPTWDAGGARYTLAIEANAGWFDEHGVRVGDAVTLEPLEETADA
jgi:uncharacterized protein